MSMNRFLIVFSLIYLLLTLTASFNSQDANNNERDEEIRSIQFLRFGRAQPLSKKLDLNPAKFLRFGRSNQIPIQQARSRSTFLRFGK